MPLEYTYCVLLHLILSLLLYEMNTRRNTTRRLEEKISNAGASPRGDQVPPLEEDSNDEQVPVNPPPLTDVDIRAVLIHLAQVITTQAQAMMAQANREVVPYPN